MRLATVVDDMMGGPVGIHGPLDPATLARHPAIRG
jgi:hypothetical protein